MSNLLHPPLFLSMLVALGACHPGRPPISTTFVPGAVAVTSAEPGLADAIHAQLAAALASRQALGTSPDSSVALSVQVLSAEVGTVAASAGAARQQAQARLVVAVSAAGPVPRQVVLQGARSFPLDVADPLSAAATRTQAFAALSQELMEDAVLWHLYHLPQEHP